VNFFADYNNLALIAIAVVSGGLLAWPQIKAGTGGKRVNTAAATQLINKRNAVVVDIRDAAEFAKGHLPQAKSAPLADIANRTLVLQRTRRPPSS
jgi:predicted sulfurtransferase